MQFCFPRISRFPKFTCFPRNQSLSVYLCLLVQKHNKNTLKPAFVQRIFILRRKFSVTHATSHFHYLYQYDTNDIKITNHNYH